MIVRLVEKLASGGLETEEVFGKALRLLEGSFAISLLDHQDPGKIYVGKNKSPLLIGVGSDFHVIASDAMAMLQFTNQFIELMDEEIDEQPFVICNLIEKYRLGMKIMIKFLGLSTSAPRAITSWTLLRMFPFRRG